MPCLRVLTLSIAHRRSQEQPTQKEKKMMPRRTCFWVLAFMCSVASGSVVDRADADAVGGPRMTISEKAVSSVSELVAATKDAGVKRIIISGDVTNAPSVRLSPGQSLQGEGDRSEIRFAGGTDGLQVSSDNRIQNIRLLACSAQR